MIHRLIAVGLLIVLTLAVRGAQAQALESTSSWTLDARLAASPAETLVSPVAITLARHRGVDRRAIAHVLAGAMLGAAVGIILLDDGPDRLCVDQGPTGCPTSPDDSDTPVLVGALIGAAAGFLYHLLAGREAGAGT